jgi:hypothetical protein
LGDGAAAETLPFRRRVDMVIIAGGTGDAGETGGGEAPTVLGGEEWRRGS